ncbi:hypothetical protein PNEG_00934 [Pneumocystis murina B123]|uniref:Probable endonuclease LCL3 n=1 Tax=Pneumocystis murina (strain B123) TaxID=1069680 RepID=M7NUM6_PNEMU|nr:hypothetical protein PNEG_00934 [Pneumocystis murina B123]EMR10786.1 hypothetical protein PNEG_00934 [Pneumocystis murina B123]
MYFWVKNFPNISENETNNSKEIQFFSSSIFVPTIFLTTAILILHKFYYQSLVRYPTASSIPVSLMNNKHILLGVVTSVGDADNFRLFHTPGGIFAGWHWLRSIPLSRKDLKDQTIHIRLSGIDAPELSHFGKEAQPYAKEAIEWLTSYILGKRVRVQIFNRDRYERIVGAVEIRKWPYIWIKRNVSLEMIKLGMAEVYKSHGAEYGGKSAELRFRHEEEKAKRKKIGIWKQSAKSYESPAEYKRRTFALLSYISPSKIKR